MALETNSEISKEKEFPIEYVSTASGYLITLIVLLYIPLLVAPFTIIPFNTYTSIVVATLLLGLAFGIYVFRGNLTRNNGLLIISPGDARIEAEGKAPFAVTSKGISQTDEKTLRFCPAVLFETRIRFETFEDCIKAWDMLKLV